MMGWRKYLSLTFCLLASAVCAQEVPRALPEYVMKAAYLYNFVHLAEWPANTSYADSKSSAFNLCIYGDDEIDIIAEQLHGKKVNGAPVRVSRITDPTRIGECQLLFLGEADSSRGAHLLQVAQGFSVLTVSDDARLRRRGVILMLAIERQRLVFDVDVNASRNAQIKLSSKLLQLARRISDP